MSNDSSKTLGQEAVARRPLLSNFKIALLCLIVVAFLYFAGQIIGSLLVTTIPALVGHPPNDTTQGSVGWQFVYGLLVDGIMLLGVAFMLKWLGWSWQFIGLKAPKAWHIILGVITVVPYYILLYAVVAVLSRYITSLNVAQKQDLGFNQIDSGLSTAMAFLSLVILPPIVEEIMMRGFLYTGLKKWMPRIAAALLVSALFGAAHLAEGGASGPLWIGAIDTFTLSLFLVGLREVTGNLWAGIILHALKNGLAFVPFLILHLH